MARTIFLDAETVPPERNDPKLRFKLEGCTDEEYRALALEPRYCRILCLGLVIEEEERVVHRGLLGRERETFRFHLDEARTLRSFWSLLKSFDCRRDLLVGFNVLDFDLHLILIRSALLQVKPSVSLPFTRFRSAPIYDCMWEFSHWRNRVSLDEMARVMGLESPKGNGDDAMNGGAVYDLFLSDRHLEIADYCMRDVEATRKIYYRLHYRQPPETQEMAAMTSHDTKRS